MKESSIEYLSLLGYLYLRNGKFEKAKTVLEALAVVSPGNAWVRSVLAYVYLQGRDSQKCLEQLDRIPRSETSTSEQVMRIRALWAQDRCEEARRVLTQMQGRLRESDGE